MAAAMQISIHGHVLTGNEVVKPDAWPTAAELENMDVEYLEQLVLARLDEMSVRSEKGYGANTMKQKNVNWSRPRSITFSSRKPATQV